MVKTEIQSVKLRFGIIGNTEGLHRQYRGTEPRDRYSHAGGSYRPFRIGDGRERCW